MGTTPNYAFPYPELTDPPDGPAQIKALATAIDTRLKTGVPTIQAGQRDFVLSAAAGQTQAITFPIAYPAAVIPTVCGNINALSSPMTLWVVRCATITNTSFNLRIDGPAATTYTAPVQWVVTNNPTAPFTKQADLRSEPGWSQCTVTCHTAGCPKEDQPIPNVSIPDDPIAWDWTGVYCGVCAQPITDIVPA